MHEPFQPDQLLLELLHAEHRNGTWVGVELLPIASRVRSLGGSESDYTRWVLASNLWASYTGSTGDKVQKQNTALAAAWRRAESHEPFHLETELTALRGRVATHTGWAGRTGSRDRAVALGLVDFCIEHNCFTRTLSSYELAKWTPGVSAKSVGRALTALTEAGLVRELDRTDRRTSARSARRYRVNLQWGVSNNGARSTGKASLPHELTPPHDLWTRKGLGPGAQRVYELLTDDPVTARHLAARTGMRPVGVKRYLSILADHCLCGVRPGAPGAASRYFRVDTPLDVVADSLGVFGTLDVKRWEVEQRQAANRSAYPGGYRRLEPA